ncbi:MAG: sulfatase-like hydrolase/transferase [Gammaproteobacteria bacterium]|nr:sulfatase-like hydrolase/transferase [Gammaproteobacteria bacterium]
MTPRPNIVLIFTDQQRADTFGYAGDPVAITPNADRLAAEGVVFPRCCASAPVCTTTRASLISGKRVHQHGAWSMADPDLRHGPSHVRNVRDAGYHTAVVGKTHLRHGQRHTHDHPDELHDWGYVDAIEVPGPVESMTTGSAYTDHLEEKGLLDVHREYLRTYVRGERQRVMQPWETPPCLLPTEDHLDMYIARKAAEWIRGYRHPEPFYLQMCFGGPHNPWDSPAEYRRRYDADSMPLSITQKQKSPVAPLVELMLAGAAAQLDGMSVAQNRVMKTYYYAKVTLIDDGIGMVLDALEENGCMDNTWIVYSADHGEMLADHGLIAKKVFYEGAVKVPLVVRPPGGVEGWVSAGLTDHLDIAATLMDAAGAEAIEASPGRSLVPLVKAGSGDANAQHHHAAVLSEFAGRDPYSMVLTDRYKMTVNTRTREPLDLYDMAEDPNELHNRVEDPALAGVRQSIGEEHLPTLLAEVNWAKLP